MTKGQKTKKQVLNEIDHIQGILCEFPLVEDDEEDTPEWWTEGMTVLTDEAAAALGHLTAQIQEVQTKELPKDEPVSSLLAGLQGSTHEGDVGGVQELDALAEAAMPYYE